MRVVHILAERGYSGGEVQLEFLLRHLHARGHQNSLVLAPGARFATAVGDLDLPSTTVDLRRPWWPPEARRLRRFVAAQDPDVLHLGCGRSLLWGGLFALGLGVPLRATTRRIDYPVSRRWYRGGRYRKLVDHVVANCESVRQRMLDAGVAADRVTLVHEGIDVEPWRGLLRDRAAARRRLSISAEALVVSCAATLRPRKGQRQLIEAFARLADDYPKARLILAGDGPDRSALIEHAADLRLAERVSVPGPIQPVADLYAASDLAVMPSFHEGLSNACLEASAAGLPLVVSDVGGLPEIVVDGETGAVVPPGNIDALHLALRRYLADPDLRVHAGAAGSARTCATFTAGRMAAGMETLFQRLLDRA